MIYVIRIEKELNFSLEKNCFLGKGDGKLARNNCLQQCLKQYQKLWFCHHSGLYAGMGIHYFVAKF